MQDAIHTISVKQIQKIEESVQTEDQNHKQYEETILELKVRLATRDKTIEVLKKQHAEEILELK